MTAYADAVCSDEVQAKLYQIDSSGRLGTLISSMKVNAKAVFSFDASKLKLQPNLSYIIEVTGCDQTLYRPVTAIADNQDVTYTTTVIGMISKSDSVRNLSEVSVTEMNDLLKDLSGASLQQAYTNLSQSIVLSSKFTAIFGNDPTIIGLSAPDILRQSVPQVILENVASTYEVNASHFNPDYEIAYRWKLDGVTKSSSKNWTYVPQENEQGIKTLSLYLGHDDGSGNIDTARPYLSRTFLIRVTNSVLPTAPAISLPHALVNSRTISVAINTGASLSNCKSFSTMAISDNLTLPPPDSEFIYECTTAGTETVSYTLTDSGDGNKTLRLWTKDASGTISQIPATAVVNLDMAAPTVTISPVTAVTNSRSKSVVFTSDDYGGSVASYECALDGATFTDCSSPFTVNSLTEGSHSVSVRATDANGNVSTPASVSWIVNLTLPVASFSSTPSALNNLTSTSLSFSAFASNTATVTSIQCSLNGAAFSTCTSPKALTGLTQGIQTFNIRAIDSSGNQGTNTSYSWTVDATAPVSAITSTPSAVTNQTSANFSFNTSDSGGAVVDSSECSLDSGSWATCSSPVAFSGLTAGNHIFKVRTSDTASNIGAEVSFSWKIDLTTSMVALTASPSNITNLTSATFSFSTTPPPGGSVTGHECKLDSGAWTACSTPWSLTSLSAGSHTASIRSIDNTGTASDPVSKTWMIDLTDPTISLTVVPLAITSLTSAQFTLSASDTGGGSITSIECQLDGGSWGVCGTTATYSSLAAGNHTFSARATDTAGNTSTTTTHSWLIDSSAPIVSMTANPPIITNLGSASFTFTASDTGGGSVASIMCSVDGGTFVTCSSPNSLSALSSGVHSFSVKAIDSANNESLVSSYSWTIDQTPPVVSIDTTPQAITNATTATFTFSASDTGGGTISGFTCSLDGGAYGSCVSPKSLAGLAAGAHNFAVKATDSASNVSSSYSFSWTVDTTPPVIAITSPAAGSYVNPVNQASFLVSGTCSEINRSIVITGAASSSTSCLSDGTWSSTLDLSASAQGTLSIQIMQTDVAGNSTTSPVKSFVKDTVLPVIAVTTPADMKGNTAGTAPIAFTMTEDNAVSANSFSVEIFDGTSWSALGSVAVTSGQKNNAAFSLSTYTAPALDITTAKVRVSYTDGAGNTRTVMSNSFTIDSTSPILSSFTLGNGVTSVANPSVSVQSAASDNLSGVTQMRLSESAAYANTGWFTWSSSAANFTLSMVNGNKTVYMWVKDAVGNVSNALSYNISLDFGSPPVISVLGPAADSTFATGATVPITWSCSGANGLAASPITIKYTVDDGTSFLPIVSDIPNSPAQYDWTLPAGVTSFRLLIECKSAAGVVASSYSGFQNSGGWSIYAGDPSGMTENVNASLALMIANGTYWQSMASDSNGNIYYARGSAIMKINSQTGLVTRFAGDPNGGGTCTMAVGQDVLTGANNKIGSAPIILGANVAKDSLIISTCSKVWLLNVTTKALSLLQSTALSASPFFLSKTGNLFYYNANKIYRLSLNSPSQTPVLIYGTGTCSAAVPAAGVAADTIPIMGNTSNACAENWLFVNEDDSKIWTGCWDSTVGCPTARRLDYNAGSSNYITTSKTYTWSFSDWSIGWCTPSHTYSRVWCNGRYNEGSRVTYSLANDAFESRPAITDSFIRYTPTPTGMVSLNSLNILTNYIENPDGTITSYQMGGSNIETYGNGNDLTKVAFSAVDDISYSLSKKQLVVRTSANGRLIDFNPSPVKQTDTFVWNSKGSSWNRLKYTAGGDKVTSITNWCGILYFAPYAFTGSTLNNLTIPYNILGCNAGTKTPHPVADNTTISGKYFGFENLLSQNDSPLIHTNGKQYFVVKSATAGVVLYSSDSVTLRWIAGRAGTPGYDPLDSTQAASGALLSNNYSFIEQVKTSPHLNDIFILDGNRLRLITVTTETTPKIYDIFNLAAVSGFPTGVTITDFVYDSTSEISNGTYNVVGSGKMYFATTGNKVYKVVPTAVSGDTVTAATLTQYNFTGTTLSGTQRLALTPAGLLVAQPSKARILKVAP